MDSAGGESSYLRAAERGAPPSERTPFVSRRAGASPPAPPDDSPGLLERPTLAILGLALVLQAYTWWCSSGYHLADSVEFMDRAAAVARGETLDSTGAVRGFGFSTLLLPFFGLARWLELEDLRPVVHAVRLFQMALGLALVVATLRLGAKLGGRSVGLVAGFLVATNPVFLQYSSDPVSGIAAAFFVAAALNCLLERRGFATSLGGGVLLGLAFLMAYQVLLVAGPLLGLMLLRDRWRERRTWVGAGLGVLLVLGLQVVLDRLTYGSWGLSIRTYLIQNMGGVGITTLAYLGFDDQQWLHDLYEAYAKAISESAEMHAPEGQSMLQGRTYYLVELPSMLVWPVIAFAVLGLGRAWRRMSWKSSILVLVLAANLYAMTLKGSKSFRLWLPLLPLIAPLCAWGWAVISGAGEATRPGLGRRVVAAAMLLLALVLGAAQLGGSSTRRYNAYWDAMEVVNAAAGASEEPVRVASAYDWAVFGRARAGVDSVKLREHLDRWEDLEPERREVVVEQLETLDWLILHGTILRVSADLTSAVNGGFEVVASCWDEDTEPGIRDVRVLRRLDPARAAAAAPGRGPLRLFEVVEDEDPEDYRRRLQLDRWMPAPALFVGQGPDGSEERLELLGVELRHLEPAGFGWLTYHWTSATGFARDYVLVDRLSTRQCPWAWQNNRQPGYGALPTSNWEPGWIVRESYLFVPGARPFEEDFRPLGGSYRRGDLLPAQLWVRGESPPPDIDLHRLLPADRRSGELLDFTLAAPWGGVGLRLPDGQLLSADHLLLVARFLLPRDPRFAWPDDGQPGPDDAVILAALRRQERLLERLRQIEAASGE